MFRAERRTAIAMQQPMVMRSRIGWCRLLSAVAAATILFGAPASAQLFDFKSLFSPKTNTPSGPPPGQASAPPEWSGGSGASGHPDMQAGAIRAAAANFRRCLDELAPQAARRGVPHATY